jgi:hypothetical protein
LTRISDGQVSVGHIGHDGHGPHPGLPNGGPGVREPDEAEALLHVQVICPVRLPEARRTHVETAQPLLHQRLGVPQGALSYQGGSD